MDKLDPITKRKSYMRKLFMLLFTIIFISYNSFAQSDVAVYSIDINDYYQDVENRILYTKVINVDSLSQKEITQLVKNWAAINFRNLRYTLVGETENQLVIRYIQDGFYTNALIKTSAPWNILLIVQVKDGKLRYQFKDEGNAYSSPGLFAAKVTNEGEYYLSSFFENKKNPGYATGKIIVPGLKNIRLLIEKTTVSLEKYMLQGKSLEDNW